MVEANPEPTTAATQEEAPVVETTPEESKEPVTTSPEESKVASASAEEFKVPSGTQFPEIVPKRQFRMPQTPRELLQHGVSLKEEGNLYFKQRDYPNAVKRYAKIYAFLKPVIPASADGNDNAQLVNMIGG